MRNILKSLILLVASTPALAQSVQQSGSVTPGHAAQWVTSGVVKDAGPATAGNLTELGISRNGGLPFCISSDPNPGNPRVQICEGVSLNGDGFISLNSYNGAAQVPLYFIVNGVTYQPFGGPVNGPAIRVVASGTTDISSSADGTIAWNSSSAAPKTDTIYACTLQFQGRLLTVKDEIGTASTYPITLSPASGTIDGTASYVLPVNKQSATLQCDGASNWVVI